MIRDKVKLYAKWMTGLDASNDELRASDRKPCVKWWAERVAAGGWRSKGEGTNIATEMMMLASEVLGENDA